MSLSSISYTRGCWITRAGNNLMKQLLIYSFVFIAAQVHALDASWVGFSSGAGLYPGEISTAYLKVYCPPNAEYWEDRGAADYIPEYLARVEFISVSDGIQIGMSLPELVIDGNVVGSYCLIDESDMTAYEMEVRTGDHLTRITLTLLEHGDFLEMTKHWLRMVSSLEYQEGAPKERPFLKDRYR